MERSGQFYEYIKQLRHTYNATLSLTPAPSPWQPGCWTPLLHGFTENVPSSFQLGCGFTFSGSLMVSVLDVPTAPALSSMPPIVLRQHNVVTWINDFPGRLLPWWTTTHSLTNTGSKCSGDFKALFKRTTVWAKRGRWGTSLQWEMQIDKLISRVSQQAGGRADGRAWCPAESFFLQ